MRESDYKLYSNDTRNNLTLTLSYCQKKVSRIIFTLNTCNKFFAQSVGW